MILKFQNKYYPEKYCTNWIPDLEIQEWLTAQEKQNAPWTKAWSLINWEEDKPLKSAFVLPEEKPKNIRYLNRKENVAT